MWDILADQATREPARKPPEVRQAIRDKGKDPTGAERKNRLNGVQSLIQLILIGPAGIPSELSSKENGENRPEAERDTIEVLSRRNEVSNIELDVREGRTGCSCMSEAFGSPCKSINTCQCRSGGTRQTELEEVATADRFLG